MLRILPAIAAVVALIVTGIVHGFWTHRWHLGRAVEEAVASLDRVPRTVGDWQAETLESNQREETGLPGQLYLRYTNRKTGESVSVALVCGWSGPVCIHTPDVCYRASGYSLSKRSPYELKTGKLTASFFTTEADKSHASDQTRLRIFWSWYADGRWETADNPRITFAGLPVLYKFYVLREMTSDLPLDQDPCVEFLRVFLPELRKVLASGAV